MTTFVLLFFSPQLILQWFISKKTINFQGFGGAPTFSSGGGGMGSNFFQGGGGV